MWSQSCVVIMFGLYIIKLKATVTLTLNRLISKLIGIIYTPIQMSVPNLRNLGSILCLPIIWTRFGLYVNMLTITVTLAFDRLTSKLIWIIYSETHICAKIDKATSIPCLVIIRTRSGLYVNMLTVIVTLTFDRLTSKSIGIIYTP